MPVLTVVGRKSPAWWQRAMQELAQALPDARHLALDGQTQIVKPATLVPVLSEFFRIRTGPAVIAGVHCHI